MVRTIHSRDSLHYKGMLCMPSQSIPMFIMNCVSRGMIFIFENRIEKPYQKIVLSKFFVLEIKLLSTLNYTFNRQIENQQFLSSKLHKFQNTTLDCIDRLEKLTNHSPFCALVCRLRRLVNIPKSQPKSLSTKPFSHYPFW